MPIAHASYMTTPKNGMLNPARSTVAILKAPYDVTCSRSGLPLLRGWCQPLPLVTECKGPQSSKICLQQRIYRPSFRRLMHQHQRVATDVSIYPNTVALTSSCRGVAADDVCFNAEVVLFPDRLCNIYLAVKQDCFQCREDKMSVTTCLYHREAISRMLRNNGDGTTQGSHILIRLLSFHGWIMRDA